MNYFEKLYSNRYFLKQILQYPTQWKYLHCLYKSMSKDYLLDAPSPWLTFGAIDYIRRYISDTVRRGSFRVFEYGSGGSTIYWLHHNAQCTSIEHDTIWHSLISNRIDKKSHADYRLCMPQPDISDKPCNPSDPESYASGDVEFMGYSFRQYVQQIDSFPDDYFDIVLIDGRARPSCIKHSYRKVKKGGLLVIDDTDRKDYLEKTAVFFEQYDHVVYRGLKPSILSFAETSVYMRRA